MADQDKRIAEIREAWRRDRAEARASFRRDWPMYLITIIGDLGLGIALGLSVVLWALGGAA